MSDQGTTFYGLLIKEESRFFLQMKEQKIPLYPDFTYATKGQFVPHFVKIQGHKKRSGTCDMIQVVSYEEDNSDGALEVEGKVITGNRLKAEDQEWLCFTHVNPGEDESATFKLPLNLDEYQNQVITVAGTPGDPGNHLHNAQVVLAPPNGHQPSKGFQQASSLQELLLIREANKAVIEKYNHNLGSALGLKHKHGFSTGEAAILIFVPQKINLNLLPQGQRIPKTFESEAHKLWCHVDVVAGGRRGSIEDIDPLPKLETFNEDVTTQLQVGWPGLIGGMQVGAFDPQAGFSYVGTAGIAVKEQGHPHGVGFLTNQHVADTKGREIFFPSYASPIKLGKTQAVKEFESVHDWYAGLIQNNEALLRCDCGYFTVDNPYAAQVQPGVFGLDCDLSTPKDMDMNSMDIIGQKVVSVGRTRGFQRGTIVAYAYEFVDEQDISMYTDFLIASEDRNAFSWKGDSGKVILTDEAKPKPIALLWGGWQERLRHGRAQEMWSYAIDLNKVLKRLKLDLYKP